MSSFCRAFCSVIVFVALLGLTGCANPARTLGRPATDKGTDPAPTNTPAGNPTPAEHLGTVHVIGTGQRFVLGQTPSAQPVANLADGQALICRVGTAITATLRASHERRPPFVVADVATGEPHVGDEVFIDPAPGRTTVSGASGIPPAVSPGPAAPDFRINPSLPPTQ